MQIDIRVLKARVREYIDGPGGKLVYGELANSLLFNVIGSLFLIIFALILICTIIMAWTGLQLLFGIVKSFLTLDIFRDPSRVYRENPDRVRPAVMSCIITGPNGCGLMLGTLSDQTQADTAFLGRKAAEFAAIYLDGSEREQGEFFKLLRDDTFRTYRRRSVPASHSEGRELILFDMEYNKDEIYLSQDDDAWLAAVISIDDKPQDDDAGESDPDAPPPGRVVQIPWTVVEDAIAD